MKSRLTVEQQTVPINDMSTDLLIVPGVILILNWVAMCERGYMFDQTYQYRQFNQEGC